LTGKRDPQLRLLHPTMMATAVVVLAMVIFTIWFSVYSARLHEAHLTHKADLGQVDLAIWNTSQGRLFQEIKDDYVSTRLTDHIELIFMPVSLVFWLWNDVRALFVLQAAALALGAWPIYLLARRRLATSFQGEGTSGIGSVAARGGAVFAIVYLLTPALQAAAVSEFHALPLAAPLIAWALWAAERRRWGWFTLAALSLLTVQEGMALLGATLGLYAVIKAWPRRRVTAMTEDPRQPTEGSGRLPSDASAADRGARGDNAWRGVLLGTIVCLLSLAWFYVATFLIIPHYAGQVYGLEQTPYVARYGVLGGSIGDVLKTLVMEPGQVLSIALEPLRLRYLFGLLVPTVFLALLGPGILLTSAPLLLANLLSSYPLQYSGELHYSAPLVPFFVIAGVAGLGWLWDILFRRPKVRTRGGAGSSFVSRPALWLGLVLLGALYWQIMAGYTPLGREFRLLVAGGWPQVTAHERLLARFAAQIPSGASLSATTDLYPHLSHRELIYQFPWLGQADWVLVDVSGTTDKNPGDIKVAIEQLLGAGWGVVDAADGYILLAHGQGRQEIPDEFYDFARAAEPPPEASSGSPNGVAEKGAVFGRGALPQHKLDVTFGDRLKLVGYDVLDNAKWRKTSFRFYWEALTQLPEDTAVAIQVLSPAGAVTDDTGARPMPAMLWYPPARWRPGERVVTETLPWYLPVEWAPVITVRADGQQLAPVVASVEDPLQKSEGPEPAVVSTDDQLRLQAWARRGDRLAAYGEPSDPIVADARFSDGDWAVHLTEYVAPPRAAPGRELPVTLRWRSPAGFVGRDDQPSRASLDYTVFVHLRGPDGQTVASSDGMPTWFTVWPTSQWADAGYETRDSHVLSLPPDLPAGTYDVVVGWYNWQTGDRLALTDDHGNVLGNEFVLTQVSLDPANVPQPDLCCATAPECCASQQ
jgi:uncharacterized membrane protein